MQHKTATAAAASTGVVEKKRREKLRERGK